MTEVWNSQEVGNAGGEMLPVLQKAQELWGQRAVQVLLPLTGLFQIFKIFVSMSLRSSIFLFMSNFLNLSKWGHWGLRVSGTEISSTELYTFCYFWMDGKGNSEWSLCPGWLWPNCTTVEWMNDILTQSSEILVWWSKEGRCYQAAWLFISQYDLVIWMSVSFSQGV